MPFRICVSVKVCTYALMYFFIFMYCIYVCAYHGMISLYIHVYTMSIVPDISAEVELLLREVIPTQQVVELVHGQPDNLVDHEGDPGVARQLLVLVFINLKSFL